MNDSLIKARNNFYNERQSRSKKRDKNGMPLKTKDAYRTFLFEALEFARYCREFILIYQNQNSGTIQDVYLMFVDYKKAEKQIKEGLGVEWADDTNMPNKVRPKIKFKNINRV